MNSAAVENNPNCLLDWLCGLRVIQSYRLLDGKAYSSVLVTGDYVQQFFHSFANFSFIFPPRTFLSFISVFVDRDSQSTLVLPGVAKLTVEVSQQRSFHRTDSRSLTAGGSRQRRPGVVYWFVGRYTTFVA